MKYIYTVVIAPSEDKTKYYARIPDLPGCITTGESLQDAITEITDAASGWLAVAEDEGYVIPQATDQEAIERKQGDLLALIQLDTSAYRCCGDALKRINELEQEIAKLKLENETLRNRNFGGRRKHDKAWMASYNDFIIKYNGGMSIAEIVDEGEISRRTAYRYLEYYRACQNEE